MDNNIHSLENTNHKHKYQELIEILNAVIFQLDSYLKYSSLNNEWTVVTGYTISETLETPFFSYVLEEDQTMLKEQIGTLLKGENEGILCELRLLSKQGVINEYHLFLRANFNRERDITSFSGTLTCLSSRKSSINDYYNNVKNYQLISENITDMVAVLAEDGLVLYASPSHTKILGYKMEDYVGSYPLKYIHPDDWERMFHFFHKMVSSWMTLVIEYRTLHEKGDWLYLEMKCTPIKGPSGEIQVICVSRDITSRKRTEEELRQANNKFKTLIESLPYGIKVEDINGNVTLNNEAYVKILSSDNQITDDCSIMNEANYIKIDYNTYECEKRDITNKCETRLSEEFHLVNNHIIERDAIPMIEDGKFDGYLWIFRDITREKLAEQKLQSANKLLKELSLQDGLTRIANRRCFDQRLEQEWLNLAKHSNYISLILIDIDYFKAFNDLYGHQAGDNCLSEIGNIINDQLDHPGHLAARYGGEEFTVLLPGCDAEQAMNIAKLIQHSVENAGIIHRGSRVKDVVTLSMGVSTSIANIIDEPNVLIAEADKALYKAKRSGRNQIKLFNEQSFSTTL